MSSAQIENRFSSFSFFWNVNFKSNIVCLKSVLSTVFFFVCFGLSFFFANIFLRVYFGFLFLHQKNLQWKKRNNPTQLLPALCLRARLCIHLITRRALRSLRLIASSRSRWWRLIVIRLPFPHEKVKSWQLLPPLFFLQRSHETYRLLKRKNMIVEAIQSFKIIGGFFPSVLFLLLCEVKWTLERKSQHGCLFAGCRKSSMMQKRRTASAQSVARRLFCGLFTVCPGKACWSFTPPLSYRTGSLRRYPNSTPWVGNGLYLNGAILEFMLGEPHAGTAGFVLSFC